MSEPLIHKFTFGAVSIQCVEDEDNKVIYASVMISAWTKSVFFYHLDTISFDFMNCIQSMYLFDFLVALKRTNMNLLKRTIVNLFGNLNKVWPFEWLFWCGVVVNRSSLCTKIDILNTSETLCFLVWTTFIKHFPYVAKFFGYVIWIIDAKMQECVVTSGQYFSKLSSLKFSLGKNKITLYV